LGGPVRAWGILMPRPPRLFLPGATYHFYCRVARAEFVFDDDFEEIELIEFLRTFRDPRGTRISSPLINTSLLTRLVGSLFRRRATPSTGTTSNDRVTRSDACGDRFW
jgi:hypothetical protein